MEGCTKPGSGSAVSWQWDGSCPRVLAPQLGTSGYRGSRQKRLPGCPLHPSCHEKQLLGAHHPSLSDPGRASRDWGPAPSAGGWMGPPASSAPRSTVLLFPPLRLLSLPKPESIAVSAGVQENYL